MLYSGGSSGLSRASRMSALPCIPDSTGSTGWKYTMSASVTRNGSRSIRAHSAMSAILFAMCASKPGERKFPLPAASAEESTTTSKGKSGLVRRSDGSSHRPQTSR